MIAVIDPALVWGAEGNSLISPVGASCVVPAIPTHGVTASDGMTGDEFDEDFDDDFDEDFDDDFEDDLDDDLDDDEDDDDEFEDEFEDDSDAAVKVGNDD